MAKRKFSRCTKSSQKTTRSKNFSRHSSKQTHKKTSLMTTLAENSEQYITNLSNAKLSQIEKIALGKGLSYVPTPAKPTRSTLVSDITTFEKRMRTAYLMHDKRSKNHPFKPPSKWHPRTTQSVTLENYLEATRAELAHIRLRNQKRNMTKLETSALKGVHNIG